ncbi:MAG TPA: DMT family transporter [Bordetella sp.]|nr:DMT family transporter [Bordetella sp.]
MAPATRLPLDTRATALMMLLCLCWGFQQIAIKLVAADISPTLQIGLRSAFAAAVLACIVLRKEGWAAFADGTLVPGLIAGSLFAAEFLLVAQGLLYTTASHMSVFLYTAPIFTALGLHFTLREERLQAVQWLGVAIAFAGIALAFLGGGQQAAAPAMLLGDLLGVLAGAAWGATTVAIRKSRLSEAPATKTLLYQMVLAGVALPLFAWATGQGDPVFSPPALASLAFQALGVALFSLLVWFWLLRRYLATRLSILSFMTPLFGVAFGVLILDEPLDAAFVAGALMVMAGILIVIGVRMKAS